jgi:hypothetical protein
MSNPAERPSPPEPSDLEAILEGILIDHACGRLSSQAAIAALTANLRRAGEARPGAPTDEEIARVLNYAAEQMGWGSHVKPFPTVAHLKVFMDEQCKLWAEEALAGARPGAADPHKFAKLATLKAGWDSYGAPPISAEAIQRARRWLESVHVVPTSDGGVQIEWNRDGVEVEVYFRANNSVGGLFAAEGWHGAISGGAAEPQP